MQGPAIFVLLAFACCLATAATLEHEDAPTARYDAHKASFGKCKCKGYELEGSSGSGPRTFTIDCKLPDSPNVRCDYKGNPHHCKGKYPKKASEFYTSLTQMIGGDLCQALTTGQRGCPSHRSYNPKMCKNFDSEFVLQSLYVPKTTAKTLPVTPSSIKSHKATHDSCSCEGVEVKREAGKGPSDFTVECIKGKVQDQRLSCKYQGYPHHCGNDYFKNTSAFYEEINKEISKKMCNNIQEKKCPEDRGFKPKTCKDIKSAFKLVKPALTTNPAYQ